MNNIGGENEVVGCGFEALGKTVLGNVKGLEFHVGRIDEPFFGSRKEARRDIGNGINGVGRKAAPVNQTAKGSFGCAASACTNFKDAKVRSVAGEQTHKVTASKTYQVIQLGEDVILH